MDTLVSVIIPSYNRFKYLLNAIRSATNQTYSNLEIIVVNDGSEQDEYKTHDFGGNVTMINLEKNSAAIFGFSNLGYVRNLGIEKANGIYIAFLDDDDIWFPTKIEEQIQTMRKSGCKMSSTNALIDKGGRESVGGVYNENVDYIWMYNFKERMEKTKGLGYEKNKIFKIFRHMVPRFNAIICSSVIIERALLNKCNNFSEKHPPGEDRETWFNALIHTDCILINKPLIYYDVGHGNGVQWR